MTSRQKEASALQQLGGLLWTIVTATASSLLLSTPLLFRRFYDMLKGKTSESLRPTTPLLSRTGGKRDAISLYEGTVCHERRVPCAHKFSYSVRYALLDLDRAPSSFSSASALHHMSASKVRDISGTTGPVYLLTVPSSVGYEQSPLSVYCCFNDDETFLTVCIAEVTNTPWGERVTFLFDPNGDTVAKALHVSPFMDMQGLWRMKVGISDQNVTIKITVEHPEHGNYFTASLCASRVDHWKGSSEAFFWLMPHKIAVGIYWQALLLWWKGVSFLQHPKYVNGNAYREDAIQKDIELSSSKLGNDLNLMGCCALKSTSSKCTRSYTWYEAQWPWT